MVVYEHYLRKDRSGNDIFDYRAYEDDEQMQILSQMSHTERNSKKKCLASHHIFSFLKRKKLPTTHVR